MDFTAISYAVMDRTGYLDRSCRINVDSVEVFFDATDPMLPAFIDCLLAFEKRQQFQGKAAVGYASLRYTGPTRATIGMQRYPVTCSVEVACLRDVEGSSEMVEWASKVARNANFKGILHWGQRNDSTVEEIQNRFGDAPSLPGGRLGEWRNVLSRFTSNGLHYAFSSSYSMRLGLEVVSPKITSLEADQVTIRFGEDARVRWRAAENPFGFCWPRLDVHTATGQVASYHLYTMVGEKVVRHLGRGVHKFELVITCQFDGDVRETRRSLSITVA